MTTEIAATTQATAMEPAELKELLGVAKYADDKSFSVVAAGGGFLPRVMLMGGNSGAVKEGKIGVGRYALITGKDKLDDLTPECVVLVLGWRPKAMKIVEGEGITTVFNHKDEEFQKIAARADSGDSDTGCMYGPEFLVWLPSLKVFASFYMSSKTSRREAPQLRAQMGKAALLKCHLITAGKFKWHGPIVTASSAPLLSMPEREELMMEVTKFNNPPENETVAAPEAKPDDRAR